MDIKVIIILFLVLEIIYLAIKCKTSEHFSQAMLLYLSKTVAKENANLLNSTSNAEGLLHLLTQGEADKCIFEYRVFRQWKINKHKENPSEHANISDFLAENFSEDISVDTSNNKE